MKPSIAFLSRSVVAIFLLVLCLSPLYIKALLGFIYNSEVFKGVLVATFESHMTNQTASELDDLLVERLIENIRQVIAEVRTSTLLYALCSAFLSNMYSAFLFVFSFHSTTTAEVLTEHTTLLVQIGTLVALVFATHRHQCQTVGLRMVFEDWLPIWSSLPMLPYSWKLLFGSRQKTAFDKGRWAFLGPMWFFVACGICFIISEGPVGGCLTILEAITRYESTSLLFTSLLGGALSLLGGGTPPKLMLLRSKPRYAALMAIQIPLWFLCPVVIPVTVTTVLCLVSISGDKPEYLAHPSSMIVRNVRDSKSHVPLCNVCTTTVLPAFNRKTHTIPAIHHRSARSLFEAMEDGCRICTAVWERRKKVPKDVWGLLLFWKPVTTCSLDEDRITIFQEENRKREEYRCQFELRSIECISPKKSLCFLDDVFEAVKVEKSDPCDLASSMYLSHHTGSVQSLNYARKWLRDCMANHNCSGMVKAPFKPTRLLYLGRWSEIYPRSFAEAEVEGLLLHTQNEFTDTEITYLTVSHCWGGKAFIKLLSSNVDVLRQEITFKSLPATLKDAIRIGKWLGFKYLWIDSLCIIQDSIEDKNVEIRRMGDVYRYARCNLAASDAASSDDGCLYPRNPRSIQPELIELGNGPKREFRALINHTDIYDDHPLYSRAWVLQEAILAPRTLECGKGQLFWRCSQIRASEVFPRGMSVPMSYKDHPAAFLDVATLHDASSILSLNLIETCLRTQERLGRIPTRPNEGTFGEMLLDSSDDGLSTIRERIMSSIRTTKEIESYRREWQRANPVSSSFGRAAFSGGSADPFRIWATIVQNFTEMQLTKAEDRIFALTGIIGVFRPFFGPEYAGMWECYLPFELLWHVEEKCSRQDPDRSPSWSWQSLDCKISYQKCVFNRNKDTLITRLAGIHVGFASRIGTKRIVLKLSGPLLRITWRGWLSPAIQRYHTCTIETMGGRTRYLRLYGIPVVPESYGRIYFDEVGGPRPLDELFCIPIIRWQYRMEFGYHSPQHRGLVLKHRFQNVYERVGYFETFDAWSVDSIVSEAKREEILLV